ncbi:MAG: hypothetical protein NDF55_04550 [archaeon GB-1867-005]|nr:hypothetical protein [Candidatus Culexmicrobium cathedralense]
MGGFKMEKALAMLKNALEKQRPEKWILITHFPPKNTPADKFFICFHVGDKDIRKLIYQYKPSACFCGHIHESPCISHVEDFLIVNPGPALKWRAAIVDLDKDHAGVISLKY